MSRIELSDERIKELEEKIAKSKQIFQQAFDRFDSTETRLIWSGGKDGTVVALYKVKGGGHNIPGGVQYLPERLIGKANRDIGGMDTLWTFFRDHARKVSRR